MARSDPNKARFEPARRAKSRGYSGDSSAGAQRAAGSHSDATSARAPSPAGNGTRGTAKNEAASRGKLVMAAKVVDKIAAQAASEVAAAGGVSGGVLGIGAKTDLSARPKVDVHLSGKTATVDVEVAVAYPTSIRLATDRVRSHIIDRVGALTGVEVTRVDIDVTAFHSTHDASRESLR